MKVKILLPLILALFFSCNKNDDLITAPVPVESKFISAVDISSFPEIEVTNPVFYNENKVEESFLSILKRNGVNTIRLRIWVNPGNNHSGYDEVKIFANKLRISGFKIWLSVHYSDTWADPGKQSPPAQWSGISYTALRDSVRSYTKFVVENIKPDIIQIGNEINPGFLLPYGDRFTQHAQYLELLNTASAEIRKYSSTTKIMIHYAGITGSKDFFIQLRNLDYDMIGISYYPLWHGKDLNEVSIILNDLGATFQKEVLIAETAYPFTLGWNDWTHNIVGLEEQLILPEYPATPEGQKDFIAAIKKLITSEVENGTGFCYWGAELIAWKGERSENASPWENQALFDFQNLALPVISEFKIK